MGRQILFSFRKSIYENTLDTAEVNEIPETRFVKKIFKRYIIIET